MKTRYEKADVNVERIKAQLEDHQVVLMKDITMLDKMYQLNLVYFKELTMYILAGKKKLEQVRTTDLKEANGEGPAHPAARGRPGGPGPGRSVRPL